MDNVSKEKRSEIMSKIRDRDTSIELIVRRRLHKLGYRFIIRPSSMPGKPDMVFTRRRTVVFIHGCFWHSHGCRRSGAPKTNGEYWKEKLAKNAERDAKNSAYYAAHGWKVITVWECEIRSDLFGALNGMVEDLGPA